MFISFIGGSQGELPLDQLASDGAFMFLVVSESTNLTSRVSFKLTLYCEDVCMFAVLDFVCDIYW